MYKDIEAKREAARRHYAKHRERIQEAQRAKYAANREAEIARVRTWQAANPERNAKNKSDWRYRNLEHCEQVRKAWVAANSDKVKAGQKRHRDRHPNQNKENAKAWRRLNPDKSVAGSKRWAEANPERVAANGRSKAQRRRARLRDACSPGVTPEQWASICAQFSDGETTYCAYCGTAPATSIDHVTPIAKGGLDAPDNVAPACRACNSSKGAKTWIWQWVGRGIPSKDCLKKVA